MTSSTNIGSLYIVATPIGNLEDITLRAIRVLKEVDYILCEDTRITQKLLYKYDISTKLISCHKFNELESISNILIDLNSGKSIALVSDAGTPLISDPGLNLVTEARKNNIKVFSVPGPSALTSAISVSGMVDREFLFIGFLPDDKSKRSEIIKNLKLKSSTVISYVGPHDLKKYLSEISEVYPDVDVFISREITKIFEEYLSGNIMDILTQLSDREIKGEIVLGLKFKYTVVENHIPDDDLIKKLNILISGGLSLKEASKVLSSDFNLSTNYIYNTYIKSKQ